MPLGLCPCGRGFPKVHWERLALCSDCLRAGRLCQSPKATSPRAKAEEQDSFSCQGVPRTRGVVVEAYGWTPELLGQGKGREQTRPDVLDRDAVCSGQRVALVLFCCFVF